MGRRLTDEERALRDLSERDFQRRYVEAIRSIEFRVAHHYDSRFSDPGTKGVPDLTIVGHGSFWLQEMKRHRGVLKPEQKGWIADARDAGITVFVCRPEDWEHMMSYAETIAGRGIEPELRSFPRPYPRSGRRKRPGSTTKPETPANG